MSALCCPETSLTLQATFSLDEPEDLEDDDDGAPLSPPDEDLSPPEEDLDFSDFSLVPEDDEDESEPDFASDDEEDCAGAVATDALLLSVR